MNEDQEGIKLAGTTLQHYRHVCAFFHSRDEEYRVLLPFIKEGIEHNQKAFHMIDPKLRLDHLQRIEQAGINVAAAEASGQLEVRNWENAYLREACFNQDAMLGLIEEALTSAKAHGFPLTRIVANMEWVLEDLPGVNDLVEYETRLNHLLPKYNDPVICTYDLARFSAGVVMDILRTHPMVIIGGTLQQNPFYVPPDEFLQELRTRVTRTSTA